MKEQGKFDETEVMDLWERCVDCIPASQGKECQIRSKVRGTRFQNVKERYTYDPSLTKV